MFISDARRFVLMFRSAIEHTPLQLYSSALLFTPTSSLVRKTFERLHTAPWIKLKPSVQSEWDACLQTLEGHRDNISFLIFSPDNTKLASSAEDGNVRIWDRATGACLQSLEFDTAGECSSMAISPDSSQLALAFDEFIKILHLKTGDCVMTLKPSRYRGSMVYSPNGMQLVLSNELWEDGCFRIWDLTTGMQLQKEDYYRGVREPTVFRPDASSEGKITVIRNPITGSRMQIVDKDHLWRVVFTSNGMQCLVVMMTKYSERIHYILDAATGECLQKPTLSRWATANLVLAPDGTQLISASISGEIQIWDVKRSASPLEILPFATTNLTSGALSAFSPDGAELASVAEHITIQIWDLTPGSPMKREEEECISTIRYSPDSTRLALITNYHDISDPFTIEIWDAVEGIRQQQLEVGRTTLGVERYSNLAELSFSPDNTQLAYSRWNEVVIVDLATNTHLNRFISKDSSSIFSIIFAPSGTRLALVDNAIFNTKIRDRSSKTSAIEIWDVAGGTLVHTVDSAIGTIEMHFSSDSRRLLSLSHDSILEIWDLHTGACLQTLDLGSREKFTSATLYLERARRQCFSINMLQNPGPIYRATNEFDLSSNKIWLLRRGQPFLWLPPRYRPADMTFSGGSIAMILPTQAVPLFCFSLAELDAEMTYSMSPILKV